jgi:hypothetical protein
VEECLSGAELEHPPEALEPGKLAAVEHAAHGLVANFAPLAVMSARKCFEMALGSFQHGASPLAKMTWITR